MAATQRMAEGDMAPILPVRRYQDEFSNLAIALNHMMYQLEKRQSILVESHKMRAVGNLTAGVAHELNNPLNNIMLTAEMLKEDWEKLSGEARFEMVDDLIQQADRARSVVKNLLDFARESETEVEHVGIRDLLDEVIRLAQNQIKISKIKLHVDIADHLPPVYGDRGLIVQVFLNLFLNAIDAMPNGGHLFVRANEEQDTGFLAVHVQDTGSGIPPLLLQSIFDPFFTTKPTGKGTGLGLAVSQGIVNQHGGDIEVMSKVGVGTTFTVHLPCVPVPAQLAKQTAESTSLASPTPSTRVEEDPTAD
jgi:signal transduction histidine kinase